MLVNWAMISALVGVALLLFTVSGHIYLYGKLVGKVDEHDNRITGHDAHFDRIQLKLERHDDVLNHHGERLSVMESQLHTRVRG
ncbi:MAG TPA: hypothetical protein VM554_12975 [Acidisarcina sp.]|nr:hypothetical protein [Acidisarcina sp.]